MKKFLFIFSLLLAALLFLPEEGRSSEDFSLLDREEVLKEKNTYEETQQRIEIISKDFKGINCLTPRRNVQTTCYSHHIRVVKQAEDRLLQRIRFKEQEQLRKVLEYLSTCQTINYSTLLVRDGYHIFTLRKLLI